MLLIRFFFLLPFYCYAIQWNYIGDTVWSPGCDWPGSDLSNSLTTADKCGPQCLSTPGCTHFTWTTYNGGTCWLKKDWYSPSDAFDSTGSSVCGFVTYWQQSGNVAWAPYCDWLANDIAGVPTSSETCGPTCENTPGCTHFTWSSGTCWVKGNSVSRGDAFLINVRDAVCGYLTSKNPTPNPPPPTPNPPPPSPPTSSSYIFNTEQFGDGTYYGSAIKWNGGGACGFGIKYPPFTTRNNPKVTLIAANPTVYKGAGGISDGCGLCVSIKGTGSGSGGNPISTTPFLGFVQDLCPECSSTSLDLAEDGDGRWGIRWIGVPCPVTASDKFYYKFQGSNPWYLKLQVVGHKIPVKSVTLVYNNVDMVMTRTSDNYWNLPSVPNGGITIFPLRVKVTSTAGEIVTDTININAIPSNNDNFIQGNAQFSGTTGILNDASASSPGMMDTNTAIYIGVTIGCVVIVVLVIVVVIVLKKRRDDEEIV